jgi:hypothetical protein
MTEQQKLERAKIKKKTDLVNKLLGSGVSAMIVSAIVWAVMTGLRNDDTWLYEASIRIVAAVAGGWIGWYSQIGVNGAQGEKHQSGDANNAEEKRARIGAVITAVLFSIVYLIFRTKESTPYVIGLTIGGVTVLVAVLMWLSVKPKKKK